LPKPETIRGEGWPGGRKGYANAITHVRTVVIFTCPGLGDEVELPIGEILRAK